MPNADRRLLTVPQFAAELNISQAAVRRWVLERRIEIIKLSRLVRIPYSEAARLLAEGVRPRRERK